jgi:hypothetical protein
VYPLFVNIINDSPYYLWGFYFIAMSFKVQLFKY